MASTSTATKIATAYPATAVEAALRNELIDVVKAEAAITGTSLPATPKDIVKVPVHVDSLIVVSILCLIEPILGFELPESVVKSGGYTSIDNAMAELLPQLEKLWTKKHGATS